MSEVGGRLWSYEDLLRSYLLAYGPKPKSVRLSWRVDEEGAWLFLGRAVVALCREEGYVDYTHEEWSFVPTDSFLAAMMLARDQFIARGFEVDEPPALLQGDAHGA